MKTIQLIIAILLLPFSIWYSVGVAIRNLLYRLGVKKTVRSALPTIGIGNLRMGGTGKTPHTEYLIRLFGDRRTALLSRGYGRKTRGYLLADRSSDRYSAANLGDEPYMIARKFPSLTVAVCEDRVEGLRQLSQLSEPPELVLLDDVYQHRHLRPTVTVLLTEYGDPFFRDFILPFGNLREFRSGRRRADVVVVTKCPPSMSPRRRNEYRRLLRLDARQQLFFSHIDYMEPQSLFGGHEWQPVREVLLVTGIANPEPLKHHFEKQCTVVHLPFPDHHRFDDSDCTQIIERFAKMSNPSKAVVTTEKDAMRMCEGPIARRLSSLPLFYIPIQVSLIDADDFHKFLRDKIQLS